MLNQVIAVVHDRSKLFVDGLKLSSQEFYSTLEGHVKKHQLKDVSCKRKSFSQGSVSALTDGFYFGSHINEKGRSINSFRFVKINGED